jgi:hypothetical protein
VAFLETLMQDLSMRRSPTQPSLRDSELNPHPTYPEPPFTIESIESLSSEALGDFGFGLQDLESLSGFYNFSDQQHGLANAFDPSHMPNSNSGQQRSVLHTRSGSITSFKHPSYSDTNFLRSIEGHAELSGPNDGSKEEHRKQT